MGVQRGDVSLTNGAGVNVRSGGGGSIAVNARNLEMTGRSFLSAGIGQSLGTVGTQAGDISVNATGAINLNNSSIGNQVLSGANGQGGDVSISASTLRLESGAQIGAGTSAAGKGGSLRVDAQDVQLIGTSADGQFPSALFARANLNSTGDAGDITVKTNTLLVRDGSLINASTYGAGKGGSLRVEAQDVQIIGKSLDGRAASVLTTGADFYSTGDGGDLTVTTNTLLVQDGAGIIVESRGTGTAGNMTLNARSIRLNNNASLSANTRSPKVDPTREQATININSQDLIITRNSNIITNATGENVIGGNININTDVLVGFQNSDISANSDNFRGGNVRINTQGIFGIQFREVASLQTSDITATGATRELSGNVQITRPDLDPTSGLVELPVNVVDRSGLIAQGCPADQGNSFVVTGRGGLPPTPEQELDDDAEWQDRRRLTVQQQIGQTKPHTEITTQTLPTKSDTPIIEATGWQITPNGDIFLVASTSNPAVHNPRNQPDTCQSRQ
ncbi:hypothetical protein DP115_04005 [Brasilonema octagenarum UFV-OR1]|uniref:S-layer family protein n=1 Tax=Brasilonema octagenarum UFV-OR1 TaxID=417115 RepID=A0ABX1M4S2_9CYAN|nr:hypothetical protein [Brasilonema octagenarum UFV-OR1]